MAPRAIDAEALGPSGNIQGGIRCFSFLSGYILSRQWKDVKVMKMLENEIRRINFMSKKQKSIKGLKFGDMQNVIDHLIRTGVKHTPNNNDDDAQDTSNADELIILEMNVNNDDGNENANTDADEVNDTTQDEDNNDTVTETAEEDAAEPKPEVSV